MVYAIKTRICALFIGLLTLIIGIIGGVETQVQMLKAVVDGLAEDELL